MSELERPILKDDYDRLDYHPYTDLGMLTHRYANILDVTTSEEQQALRDSIEKLGQLEPIVLYQDKILDGRHRYKACVRLGIEPQFISPEFRDDEHALEYVLAKNLTRRNLDKKQRDKLFLQIKAEKERLLREKAKANLAASGNGLGSLSGARQTTVDTIGELADMAGIPRSRAAKLQAIERSADPGIGEAVNDFLDRMMEKHGSVERAYQAAKAVSISDELDKEAKQQAAKVDPAKLKAARAAAIAKAHALVINHDPSIANDFETADLLQELADWIADALA